MYLCLDYGDRYIGVAATDYDGKTPHRIGTIDQMEKEAIPTIGKMVSQQSIQVIVVGVPKSLKGGETEQTQKTMQFIELLKKALGDVVRIDTADEVYSSLEAQRIVREEGKGQHEVHAEAARLMLDGYLKAKDKR